MSNSTILVVVLICLALLVLSWWILRLEMELNRKLEIPKGKVVSTLTSNYRNAEGNIEETIVYLILSDKGDVDRELCIDTRIDFDIKRKKK